MAYSKIHAQAFSEAHGDIPHAPMEVKSPEIVIPVHHVHPHAERWFVGLSVVTIVAVMGGWFVFLRGQLHGLVSAVPATAQSLDFLGDAATSLKMIGEETIQEAQADLGPETMGALLKLKAATDRTIMIGNVLDSVTTEINNQDDVGAMLASPEPTYAEETQNPTAEVTN